MGIYEVRMPQLGETVEEGTVVSWLKAVGDEVDEQEAILEISTEKVDTEVESAVSGTLQRILVEEGRTVDVGTVLAEIDTGGEAVPATASQPEVSEEPAQAEEPQAGTTEGPRSGADLQLSPVVRRLVKEHGIDLDDLAAYADRPRVSRKVVEAYLDERGSAPAPAAPADDGTLVPFNRVRKVTADRMVASKATSAHVVTAIEVDFEDIARLRASHRDQLRADRGIRLTWLPFVACAVARTLGDFERLNASVRDGEALVVHPAVHLGIAVDLAGEGLVVPVLRDAAKLDLLTMAERIQDVAARARNRELKPDDVSGGTFTITGQGPHGTLFTAPIINQPQVAILSVDGIRKRPVVAEGDGQDGIVAHHTGVLALSWDHRAIDGVYAAGFLAALRDALEGADWSTELG